MQDLLEILNSNQLLGRQVRPHGDIPFEEMEKSLWSPFGGTASGAGGNTTNGFIGAEGYAKDNGAVGILQNVRTGDPLRNSEDYLKQFQLERFENMAAPTVQNLPEKMQQDLSKFNIKTNQDLDYYLRELNPNSDIGKQIYPILDKHGYRSTISTRAYNNVGDGSFYVGNLNPKATVTSYPASKISYIELPHHNAMYTDPYSQSLIKRMNLDPMEIPKYYDLRNAVEMSLKHKQSRRRGLVTKINKLVKDYHLTRPNPNWTEGYRYPLIPYDIKDLTKGVLGSSGAMSLPLYGVYKHQQRESERVLKNINTILKHAGIPEIGNQDLYEYFKKHPHPILNADNVYNSASNRDLYFDLLKKLKNTKQNQTIQK